MSRPGRTGGRISPTEIAPASSHHQAVEDVAPGLEVAARASDGTIEALEWPARRFVLGVQWHPEDLAAARVEHRRLFEALVAAAGATHLQD